LGGVEELVVGEAAEIVGGDRGRDKEGVELRNGDDEEVEGDEGGFFEADEDEPGKAGEEDEGESHREGDESVESEEAAGREREADGKERGARGKHRVQNRIRRSELRNYQINGIFWEGSRNGATSATSELILQDKGDVRVGTGRHACRRPCN